MLQPVKTAAMSLPIALCGCDIPIYQYSAEEKSSAPSSEATDIVNQKAFAVWDSRLKAMNEALAYCGLPQTTRSKMHEAGDAIGAEFKNSDVLNRHLSFKCPEPGKDTQ